MLTIQDYFRWPQQKAVDEREKVQFSKYEKQRLNEALVLAQESGFFLNLTPQLLLKWFHTSSEKNNNTTDENNKNKLLPAADDNNSIIKEDSFQTLNYKMNDLQYVCLSYSRLSQVGAVEFCHNLVIIILDNNFLTTIQALAMCRLVKKLDIHSNHIESLPTSGFWSSMKHLQHLYVHDNPIGKTSAVSGLVSASQLTVLTLYDTPLSLKKNYRHHLVNSILSLKALDHKVISDADVIENLVITNQRFSTTSPNLQINLYRKINPKNATVSTHVKSMQKLNQEINLILKHHSAVLVIQRFVRGHLTRIHLGLIPSSIKGNSETTATKIKPKKSISQTTNLLIIEPKESKKINETSNYFHSSAENSNDQLLKINLEQLNQKDSVLQLLDQKAQEMDLISQRWMIMPPPSSVRPSDDRRLNTPQTAMNYLPKPVSFLRPEPTLASRYDYNNDQEENFNKFLDKLNLPSEKQLTAMENYKIENDNEVPLTNYRLSGKRQSIEPVDVTVDNLWRRTLDGELVRQAEQVFHRQKLMEPPPARLSDVALKKHKTDDQRRFQRTQGTMNFFLLRKWDVSDEEVRDIERTTILSEKVQQTREMRSQMKGAIELWKQEKHQWAQSSRRKERLHASRSIETKLKSIEEELKTGKMKREQEKQVKEFYKQNRAFAQDFRAQQTSVSKALLRHDRQVIREDKLMANSDLVQTLREEHRQHMQTIQEYLEQQRVLRQTEIATQRAAIENHILQETTERVLQAQARVDHLRSLRHMAEQIPPSLNMYPENPSLNANSFKNLDNWSGRLLVVAGRVGKHPPQ